MKKNKKTPAILISALGLLLLGSSLFSCVDEFKVGDAFLAKPPSVDIDKDSIFSDPTHARGFLWNAYNSLYFGLNWNWGARENRIGMGVLDALTDNFTSGLSWDAVNGLYYPGQFNSTSDPNSSIYSYTNGEGQWTGIRKAYLFIENVGQTPRMDDTEKTRLTAEAKMIIACHYADMFRNFGGLPLVKGSFEPNDEFKIPRSTARETMKFITDLCDEAYAILPFALPAADVEQWSGRFTGAAALGLKIRILLFGASPLFNDDVPYHTKSATSITEKQVWFGAKDPSLWGEVVTACDEFMVRNEHEGKPWKLVKNSANPRQGYQDAYFVRANGELLIDTRIRATVSWFWDQGCYYLQSIGAYGALTPTLDYVDSYPYADGRPFDSSFWDEQDRTKYTDVDPFANRDPRLYETCLVNNDPFQGRLAELWLTGRERGGTEDEPRQDGGAYTGFATFKFLLDRDMMVGKQSQWPYLRLSEIYLSYAEALNESGRTSEAYQYVDVVRDRVNLPGIQGGLNQIEMREAILLERALEFGGEEVRYYDMTRWKRHQDFRKRLHGVNIRRELDATGNPTGKYSYEKYTLKKRFIQDDEKGKVFFDPKWYLCPFPFAEMNKGYLTQNPGW